MIQGWGEAVEERQTQTKEQELVIQKSTVSTLSAYPSGKQGLTYTQLSYGNSNIRSIPVGEDGLIRQSSKKATALRSFKN